MNEKEPKMDHKMAWPKICEGEALFAKKKPLTAYQVLSVSVGNLNRSVSYFKGCSNLVIKINIFCWGSEQCYKTICRYFLSFLKQCSNFGPIFWSQINLVLFFLKPTKIYGQKFEIWKLLVIAFRKYMTSYGLCSVTVQRHQYSVNLKVWLTNWLTNLLTVTEMHVRI